MTAGETTYQDSMLDCVMWMCSHYGFGMSRDAITAGLPKFGFLAPRMALDAFANAGMQAGLVERELRMLPGHLLPMLLIRKDKGACILLGVRSDSESDRPGALRYQLWMPEIADGPVEYGDEQLLEIYGGFAILVKPAAKVDTRAGAATPEHAGHWLFRTIWRYRRFYYSAALGALLINMLGLASVFFTMNVYDRVVPNQAFVTLWSLALGVVVAMTFEGVSRYARSHLLDTAGKKADLVMGTILFRKALSIRMENKPQSSGSFANQLREFESVRDFATSATLSAVTDLPFVLLFAGVIFAVGGPLGWIPAMMIPLIVGISVAIQWPLARAMKESLREASLKQGVLIESIEGLETLKSVGGEGYMQKRWEIFSAMQSATSQRTKTLSSRAMTIVQFLQQVQTVVIVVTGVYLITEGRLTQGSLIASVMLASRATAPLNVVMGLALRFQQAKAAFESLNKLMAMPSERDPAREYLTEPLLEGRLELKGIRFSYPAPPMQPNPEILKGIDLTIDPGERVAVLGRIGSGKSTLLRAIGRLYVPTQGTMFLGGLAVEQIDPADWRRAVGYVGQDTRLFYGSLRQNVMIARPDATTEELLRVLRLTGLDQVAARHPMGVNLPIGEGGSGLSGGQRQLVSLARTLLTRPQLLLLDEPTSAMDTQTETAFIDHLARATAGETLIVVTHRSSLLALVDRIVVIEDGRVVADGPKERILAQLAGAPGSGVQGPRGAEGRAVHAASSAPATPSARTAPATPTAPSAVDARGGHAPATNGTAEARA
ncbi:type I secretion system permease/ATPase [Burkholderia cenocepacia]|uniref:type I secretion system permease/ATPase n=1 Tax=Burkholderia cenocepacia TaxID=95486 RepID=UPI0026528825|nr:type I secretion system permease/ATPase [Burkholderia cenocepacia]MDN7452298.1 type I secretion system permease/ATPase [Burkholderia cenocepacia]